jgi:hypothetical protein
VDHDRNVVGGELGVELDHVGADRVAEVERRLRVLGRYGLPGGDRPAPVGVDLDRGARGRGKREDGHGGEGAAHGPIVASRA